MHGCDRQLAALHARLRDDLRDRPLDDKAGSLPLLVHLGDYIDRGPHSAAVIERLLTGLAGFEVLNLMGNHERTALDALDGHAGAITDWQHYGGRATLESWGVDPDSPPASWPAQIPEAHVAFMRALSISLRIDGYLFVHAGVRPGIPLAEQTEADMLSIRMPFLFSEADFGCVVVHGHTPASGPPRSNPTASASTPAPSSAVLSPAQFWRPAASRSCRYEASASFLKKRSKNRLFHRS